MKLMDRNPKNLPVAPRKVRDQLHKAWMAERPQAIKKKDTTLKIAWVGLMIVAFSVAGYGAQAGPKFLIWVSLGVGVVASVFIILKAQRMYRSGIMDYFYSRLDEDGVLTICAGCGYDLRACNRPRRKCPECGKTTWNVAEHNKASSK